MGQLTDKMKRAMAAFRGEPESYSLPQQESAYSDVSALVDGNMPRYNPDDLIGRKGYKVYKQMMTDEQVKAVVRFKRNAITARQYYFEIDNPEMSEEEKARRLGVAWEIVKRMHGSVEDAMNKILSAMYNGFSMTEKTFKLIEVDGLNWWGIRALSLKPFDTFYFKTDAYGNIEQIIQDVSGDRRKVDPERFIHFVQNPDVDSQYGQSELREAYRSYFSKDVLIRIQNIYFERVASGFTTVQPPEGKVIRRGTEEYSNIMSILRNMQAGTGVLLPPGFTVQTHYPGSSPGFADAINFHDQGIAKALLVPNLMGISHQGNVGSQAQAQTQLEAFLWMLDAEAVRLEEALNEQLFRPLGLINFGDEDVPLFKLKPLSKSQLYELVRVWAELVGKSAVLRTDSDEAHVRNILGFPEKPEGEEGEEPEEEPGQEGEEEPGTGEEDGQEGANEPPGEPVDETVAGRGLVSVSAFTRAVKRVDFAVIQKQTEADEEQWADAMARSTDAMVGESLALLGDLERLGPDNLEAVQAFDFDAENRQGLEASVREMLREGWRLGERHARDEIDKARGEDFSVSFSRRRLDFVGLEFFDLKTFTISGKLTTDMLAVIKNILMNGVKGQKPTAEVRQEIVNAAASEGFVSRDFAEQELGQALGAEANPRARLNNIVRTNSFEAINEARMAYFTDPQQDGFVEALEYSAILDSRTTQICQHLDGKVYPADSPEWNTIRPPNHFQCRSLLIPVTAVDAWTESEPPSMRPQKGFG